MEYKFKCRKCGHIAYMNKERPLLINELDCPNCGEEPYDNWIFLGEGSYQKEILGDNL